MKKSQFKPLIMSALTALAMGAVGTVGTFALFTDKAETTVDVASGVIDLKSSVAIDNAWELNNQAMVSSGGVFSNSIGGSVYVDSAGLVQMKKLAPGDGARMTITPNNTATNINTKMRLVVTMSGNLASALVVRVNVGSEEKMAFQGAKTLYTPWVPVAAFANPDTYTLTVQFPDKDNGVINFNSSDNIYQGQDAILSVTYQAVQSNAQMDDTLELINTKLINEGFVHGDNKTMYDALGDLSDAQVSAVRQRGYVWNVNTDQFYNFTSTPADAYNYFHMYTSMPTSPSYSVYADTGWTANEVSLDGIGFDAGSIEGITKVSYKNTGAARNVTIRTNSYATNLVIDDETTGAIHHYGYTGALDIIQCHTASYHENGVVAYATVSKGRVVLEEDAQVSNLHISSIKDELEQTTDKFDEIIIAFAEGVTKPTFSRDDVDIDANGTLVVAIQTGTEEINDESTVDYVWLTKQGIFEQIKVSSESTSMEDAEWVDDFAYEGTNTQDAAYEIANNIGRNETTKKVESQVENYTVVLDEETRDLVVTDSNQQVIEEVTTVETVVAAAVEDTGLSQTEIEKAKTEIVETAVIEEIETKDYYGARIGTKAYETLADAIEAAQNGDVVTLTKDVSETISIHKNITLDLGEHELSSVENKEAITVYDLDSVTIKNGTINGQIRIGEHQATIVKWKAADKTKIDGYHPLAPAKNVELKDLEINAGAENALYFTNIEDDLTRANDTNPFDQDLYGKYIYKTGYQTYEQSVAHNRDEIFTVCEYKDKVTVNNCDISSNIGLIGNMHDIDDNLYTEVLEVRSGTFSNDSLGRFLADGKYLLGQSATKYVVVDQMPNEYIGKVNNIYYNFAGGANKAITYANFGETVYIKEAADVEKVFGENKHGVRDELTIVYEDESALYTGAAPYSSTYSIVEETDENAHLFYASFAAVAAVYQTGQGDNDWRNAQKKGDYGSLKDAFNNVSDYYTVVILRDFTVGDEQEYKYSDYYYYCAAGYANRSTIDFNGHMITYTGEGACIVTSQQSGPLKLKDTSGTNSGGITATENGAFCFRKVNASTDTLEIYGGRYISQKGVAFGIDKKVTNGITIGGGYFEGKDYWLSTLSSGITVTINGGTFVPSQDARTSHAVAKGGYKDPNASCLVEGTMVRMADGSLKDVAQIVAGDELMVFDHMTGEISSSVVVFNDAEEHALYDVLALSFSNGQTVEVVDEHGFFDLDLMRYVYIDNDNYADFIGHSFYTMNGSATLTAASLSEKECAVYSPVTAGTLNLFVGDLLSMPGGVEGLFNIFEYDADLSYNEALMAEDIAEYGLLDYSYFEDLIPYEVYEAFNGRYLGVAMGKGILDEETLLLYIERYSCYWN